MAKRAVCELCGDRFEGKRDPRRWKAVATPVGGTAKVKPFIVCTDCFLELAESEYGA
jgi:hypothetical protein